MRDSEPTEDIGDQTVANRGSGSEGAMFGSVVGRRRRSLWAILSLLFALGFAVSAIMAHSERNAALDSVAERAREESHLATAGLTGKQLTKPITGSSYDKVAGKIRRSDSSEGSVAGVTIWSSRGRILFSLKKSLVGSTPPEMRSLITGIAEGSGSTRVLGGTVQTFTPVSKGADGAVAIVEVDQPFAVVVAQTSDLWSTLRLVSAVGLVVSLLLLGLTFVSSKWPVRAQEDAARTPIDEPQENDEGAEMKAQGQQPAEQPPTEKGVPTYAEVFGQESDRDAGSQTSAPEGRDRPVQEEAEIEAEAQPSAEPLPAEERALTSEEDLQALDADLDEAVDEQADEAVDDEAVDRVEALEAYGESQESMGQWPEEFRDMVRDMARGGDAQTQEMRQRREEFKNRAKQAELRLKKQEAELHEAPSAPSAER
jgi:uncharacterized membrane protein YciS (DUF1049 family)